MLFALSTFASTGPANGSTLERWLIMPGPVTNSHAKFEDSCSSCHDPLSDRPQFESCTECHDGVGDDLRKKSGLHGRLPEAQQKECSSCHTDHEGRDTNIVNFDASEFDHTRTDFPLHRAHTSLACTDCHAPGSKHRDAPVTCSGCHGDNDPHKGQLGEQCASCHNEQNWSDTRFDHSVTAFPLTGSHLTTNCTACHRTEIFADVGRSCVACHRSDDVHQGGNGEACADCHGSDSWSALTFNHFAVAGFQLEGGHKGLRCLDCHSNGSFNDLSNGKCNSCHRSDDVHETRNGSDCASCHGVSTWSKVDFDHERRTNVALPPGHGTLECGACHRGKLHDEIPRSCAGCHASDDVHKRQLGTVCTDCHVATSWTARLWFDHDLINFPLLGAHADVACDQCHASAAFHDASTHCFACHANDNPHGGGFGDQCGECHNPSTWQAWQFDHDTQTGFPLRGGHASAICSDCHDATDSEGSPVASDCNSCHSRDDPHFGQFGTSCDSCHSVTSFSNPEGM